MVRSLSLVVLAAVVVVIYCFCASSMVSGDVAADRKECTEPLTALYPCLSLVQGNGADTGSPTPDCCRAIRMLLNTNTKCLCILIKDRNSLGIAFNVTTAIRLPSLCQTTVNTTRCIDLLQLPANSPDIQFFKQLSNVTGGSTNSPGSGSGGSVAGAPPTKNGWTEPRGVRLVGVWMVLLWSWFLKPATMAIWN